MDGKRNSVIIVGSGYSVNDGIALGLWDKVKDSNIPIVSINYSFMAMPIIPNKQVWLDTTFFKNNSEKLYELHQKGCTLCTKQHNLYNNIASIQQYKITRELNNNPFNENNVFIGTNGLSGFFALSLATIEKYKTIYLLGYDFGTNSINNTKTHFYQDVLVVKSSGVRNPGVYRSNNNTIKRNVNDFSVYLHQTSSTIYNVSPNSNIPTFNKISYPIFFEKIS